MPRLQWPVITVDCCSLSESLGTWEVRIFKTLSVIYAPHI